MEAKALTMFLTVLFILGVAGSQVSSAYELMYCEWNNYNVRHLAYWIRSDVEQGTTISPEIIDNAGDHWNGVVKSEVPNFYEVSVESNSLIRMYTFYDDPDPCGKVRTAHTEVTNASGQITLAKCYFNNWTAQNNYWQDSNHKEYCVGHELGHSIGLDETNAYPFSQLMNWEDNYKQIERHTPQTDDISGANYMYDDA